MRNQLRPLLSMPGFVALLMVGFLLLSGSGQASGEHRVHAVNGVLDLQTWNLAANGPLSLQGQWEFYWNQQIKPHDFIIGRQPKPTALVSVPGIWNTAVPGQKLPADGFATYRLKVILNNDDIGNPLGFRATYISSAFRLFINDHEVMSAGVPGTTRETTIPSKIIRNAYFTPKTKDMDIVVHVSNFHLQNGGFKTAIIIGNEFDILRIIERSTGIDTLLFGALLIFAFYHLMLFFQRKSDKSYLYFALLCLTISIRVLFINERHIYNYFPDFPWELFNKIDYLTVPAAIMFLLLFTLKVFDFNWGKWFSIIFSILYVLLFSIFIFTPTHFFLKPVILYNSYILIFATLIYIIFLSFKAIRAGRDGSLIYLAGSLLFLLSVISDIVYNIGIIGAANLTSFGLLFLILSHSIILSRKFSVAFSSAEKHSEVLRKSEERLQLALQGAGEGIIEWNIETDVIIASPELTKMLGYDVEEFPRTGKDFLKLIHADDRETGNAKFRDLLTGITSGLDIEERLRTKDGEYKWILARGKIAFRDVAGKALLYLGTHVDISQRKLAENLLSVRLRLMEFATGHSLSETLQKTLDEVCEIVFSPIGFYHFVDQDQKTISLQEWSTRTVREFCTAQGKGSHYDVDKAGVWVDCLRQRRPIIHNDYASLPHRKGLPAGHAPVIRELVVPIMRDNLVVAILGVGNKSSDYTEKDMKVVEYLADVAWEVAARKQSEDALIEQLKFMQVLIDTIPIPVFFKDMNRIYLGCNRACEEFFGPRDQLLGKTVYDITTNDIADIYYQKDLELFNNPGIQIYETLATDTTGAMHNVIFSKATYQDKNGNLAGLIGAIFDITERKQAEQSLRASEGKFRSVVEKSLILICIVDDAFKYTYVNDHFCNVTGYLEQEILGKNFTFLLAEESKLMAAERYQRRQRREDVPAQYEISFLRKNGEKRIGEVRSAFYRDASGKVNALIQVIDITERKQAEEELKNALLFNKHIIDSAQEGIIVFDYELRYQLFNPFMENLTGLKTSDVIGRTPSDVFPFLEESGVIGDLKKVLRGEKVEPREFQDHVPQSGRSGWVITTHVPLLDSKGEIIGVLVILRDITEQKRTTEQLQQSQKMEAIGTLAGGIAHDFNNILSVIIGYTELAMDRDQNENKEQDLQKVLNGAQRAKNLVRQILTFSRQDDHEKKPLEIKQLLKEAVKFLRSSIPTTVEIDQQLTGEECNIMADPTQMHQVIMNLCTNAAHAMKETGGILKIELTTPKLAKGDLPSHPELKPGHYVKLTVSDTGYGIDSAVIQNIFDPFFTTKPVDEGTGLGLSVVYGIVKSHGGVIQVYSEPGQGATFNIYLPRIIHSETMLVDMDKPVIGGTERILFVDDESVMVDIGKRLLLSLGYHATVATSSIDALDLFRAEPQSFDLVIADMTMPKMTGIDLSREMLKIRPDIPIILCSGITEPKTEAQVKTLGIKAYLKKPLTKRELAQAIRDTFDKNEKPIS